MSSKIFLWRYKLEVTEIVLNYLKNSSAVRQPLFFEDLYSLFKKVQLFSWVVFYVEGGKFPFATLLNWLLVSPEKCDICFMHFLQYNNFGPLWSFLLQTFVILLHFIFTHELQISQQATLLFFATVLVYMLHGNFVIMVYFS